ncbi:hypothetical protein MYSTI_07673 [Myxococcus stipitatus DSM 14675]|uniref:Lipoprotein n=1 Tax=Myxococcus stipitatus (strain DSM 14675 / JCM 12634 / Mx s8) TaxID=1278073 RepID=L7UM48_MYXSD|nr:hypothetical protein [Myxococcus stipitatus]AGC48945.1 hypothetical protein MYSTI_07673 [Myxococcus stipitatus DSM 14675]
MKRLAAGVCLVWLCLSQGTAQGAEDCIVTHNQGSATVALSLYEQSCATITWTPGVITTDVTYNCCGPSAVIRINGTDWNRLITDGKLDSLRYQKIEKKDGSYAISFRKVVGTNPTDIAPKDFFK